MYFECLFLNHGVTSILKRKSKEITLITTRENREIIISLQKKQSFQIHEQDKHLKLCFTKQKHKNFNKNKQTK